MLSARDPAQFKDAAARYSGHHKVAVLMAPRLGDSLLMMCIAHNLHAAGRQVSVFGNYIDSLAEWFPHMDVRPSLQEGQAREALQAYDLALQMHPDWPFSLHLHHPENFYYDRLVQVTGRDFVKLPQIAEFCRSFFALEGATTDNGLRSRDPQSWRSHKQRVVIHPTSTGAQRCWAPGHFRALGLRLLASGHEPCFIVAPHERADWAWVRELGMQMPELPSLSEVAGFIHASGWFIGNESGIGHLASNLGIPTLSLTGRPTRTRCWLPSWSPASFVYPRFLVGGRLRDRYWRTALLPGTVMRAFRQFQADTEKQPLTPFCLLNAGQATAP